MPSLPIIPVAANASFPGVKQVISCSFTLSHGVSPSTAIVEIEPQVGLIGTGGTLVIAYTGGVLLEFPDCKVDSALTQYNQQGQLWRLVIRDRRWKWAFGSVTGRYNARDGLNRPFPAWAKTVQDLAALLLLAMGETGFDVSLLPDNTYPEVDWSGANPAHELATLCDQYACRVVLGLDNLVRSPLGVGSTLPLGELIEVSAGINPPERPDSITVLSGPTRYQNDYVLYAVGMDTNGQIRRIDELSYEPALGWGYEDPYLFPNVLSGQAQELARRTVFRWYAIANMNRDGTQPMKVPGYPGLIVAPGQIELQETQNDCWPDVPGLPLPNTPQALDAALNAQARVGDGDVGFAIKIAQDPFALAQVNLPPGIYEWKPLPATVYGTFFDGRFFGENTPGDTFYFGSGFKILPAPLQWIVEFGEPLYYQNVDGSGNSIFTPPPVRSLYIRTAALIRNIQTFAYERQASTLTYPDGGWGTGTKILRHDEITPLFAGDWDNKTDKLKRVRNNLNVITPEADYYLSAANNEYQTTSPGEGHYRGILPISPDGAIQQVTWSFSTTEGPSTRASRNNEYSPVVPSYRERRTADWFRVNVAAATAQQLRRGGNDAPR